MSKKGQKLSLQEMHQKFGGGNEGLPSAPRSTDDRPAGGRYGDRGGFGRRRDDDEPRERSDRMGADAGDAGSRAEGDGDWRKGSLYTPASRGGGGFGGGGYRGGDRGGDREYGADRGGDRGYDRSDRGERSYDRPERSFERPERGTEQDQSRAEEDSNWRRGAAPTEDRPSAFGARRGGGESYGERRYGGDREERRYGDDREERRFGGGDRRYGEERRPYGERRGSFDRSDRPEGAEARDVAAEGDAAREPQAGADDRGFTRPSERFERGGYQRGGFRDNRGEEEGMDRRDDRYERPQRSFGSGFGGDRERFGGDRERFGGDRERFGGDRERFGGDREREPAERPAHLRLSLKRGGAGGEESAGRPLASSTSAVSTSAAAGSAGEDNSENKANVTILLNRYLSHQNVQKVTESTTDYAELIKGLVNMSLQSKREEDTASLIDLFSKLQAEKVVSQADVSTALSSVFAAMSEYNYSKRQTVAKIVAQAVASDTLPFKTLAEELKSLIDTGKAGEFLADVMVELKKMRNEEYVESLVNSSGLVLIDYVRENARTEEKFNAFLKQSQLSFLIGKVSYTPTVVKKEESKPQPAPVAAAQPSAAAPGPKPSPKTAAVPAAVPAPVTPAAPAGVWGARAAAEAKDTPSAAEQDKLNVVRSRFEEGVRVGETADALWAWVQGEQQEVLKREELFGLALAALMTAGDKSGEEAFENQVASYTSLFKKLLKASGKAKQSALRGLFLAQQTAHDLKYPKLSDKVSLIEVVFRAVFDNDVLSEETIWAWRDDEKDTTPGKQRVLIQVNSWLNWLKEAEEDEEEDDE